MHMLPRTCGMTGRRRIASIAIAAVILSPLASDHAAAETIILKNGTEIPCRILHEDKQEVVARTADGIEMTYNKKDISRIDRSVSSVEIYEAVAERITDSNLATALYLGYWCLENGLEKKAKRLFEEAHRDDVVSARAYLASAKLADTDAMKSSLLAKATAADPSLKEVVDALGRAGPALVELPEDLIRLGSRLFTALRHKSGRDVLKYVSSVERYPDVAARTAYAERFRAFTGLSFAAIRERCRARPGGPSRPASADGHCRLCGGTGYVRCPICKGKGYKICRTCKGAGKIRVKKRSSKGTTTTSEKLCPSCGGTGGKDCRACARLPVNKTQMKRYLSTEQPCTLCNGTGKVAQTSRFTTSRSEVCSACHGTGMKLQRCEKPLTITSSGWRRCSKCNKDGHIPLPGSGYRRTTTRMPSSRPTETRTVGILDPDERARFDALAKVFVPSEKNTGLRWQAGPKVPFSFSPPEKDTESRGEVFAFGQWCTPSTRDLKAKTAKALGYKPRKVDISKFNRWMLDRELAYLRKRSRQISPGGAGEAGTGDVRALLAALECARRARVGGGIEQSTVVRTTFEPGRRGISFVLLDDKASWPAKQVVLAPVPKESSGFDFGPVSAEIRSKPQAVTLYYRIRSSSRESVGQGVHASTRVVLSAEVLAATLGPRDRPTKVWLRGALDS